MKTHRYALIAAMSLFSFANAWAQAPETAPRGATAIAPSRNYNSATQSTGTILKKDIRWDSKIPLNKTYGELTEEQRAELHKMYQALPAGDEPPFPEAGIKPIFNAIRKAQRILQSRGTLDLTVTVGPDGKAIKVENFSSVRTGQMTDHAQEILLLTKYKPAMCHGEPCTMQFRFTQKLLPGG
jgi:hypothetical protein